MARFHEPPDDDEDDLDSDEDDVDTVPCAHCGKGMYEDSERCPHCGNYASEEDAPSRTPTWIVVTAIICLLIALTWAFG